MTYYNVAIIGSGPSGASAAFYLAKKGVSVVIIEKETLPRYKTCGGGFVYRGRKNLPFDITEVVEREFYSVQLYIDDNLFLESQREKPIITMIMRDAFDNLIVEKAKEFGVILLENHKLIDLTFSKEKVILNTSQGEISAKFVIAADGALSPTAKMAGWKKDTRKMIPALEYEVEVPEEDFERLSKEVRFDIDAIPYGYAWSFPKKNHLSIGVVSTKRTKINLKEYYKKYLKTLGIKEVISESQHGFQIPISPRTDGFVKNNVFLIGDAAGFADPVTAEGISNAIYSGRLAAESITEGNLESQKAMSLYIEKLNVKFISELKTGLYLSKCFYEQKRIRNMVLKKYGHRFCNAMTDVFMGERTYPVDIKKTVLQKIKKIMFS